jgi:hypothetical protein
MSKEKMKDKIKNQDSFSDGIDKLVEDVNSIVKIIANKDEQINFLLRHNKWLKERNVILESEKK